MEGVFALWLREWKRYLRSRPQILASLGEVAYDWDIDSDALAWSANAAEVLLVGSLARIATGGARG